MELNLTENYTPDVQTEINQVAADHTKDCAYNMAMHVKHLNCRDCPCHHYNKF